MYYQLTFSNKALSIFVVLDKSNTTVILWKESTRISHVWRMQSSLHIKDSLRKLRMDTWHNTNVYPGERHYKTIVFILERHYITIVFILKKFHINPYNGIFYIKYIFYITFSSTLALCLFWYVLSTGSALNYNYICSFLKLNRNNMWNRGIRKAC
jgi:hypothetical protein